jgi:hypothetical protein
MSEMENLVNLDEIIFAGLVRHVGPLAVTQIFENAMDSMPEDGTVTYSTPDATSTITVRDAEVVSFIFETFGPYSIPMDRAHEIVKSKLSPDN